MSHWHVVIGSNYGDEGKGLFTDYFCRKYISARKGIINVRFNGGSQAGHTVETQDGRRHVFSHFGAGTFAGASTYLAEKFIVNPTVFCLEREVLGKLHTFTSNQKVIVDPDCIVTTPFDVGINQTVERARDKGRHGSCGLGINETVERSLNKKFLITVKDLTNPSLKNLLLLIAKEWIPYRCAVLGIDHESISEDAESRIDFYLDYVKSFLSYVEVQDRSVLEYQDHVVLEGAQGLALDERYYSETNTFVTRSSCGIANVLKLTRSHQKAFINPLKIDVTYVTRSYLTRHGAGPLDEEIENVSNFDVGDQTNIPNEWQGSLRVAPLGISSTFKRIRTDLSDSILNNTRTPINAHLAITWMDRLDEDSFESVLTIAKNVAKFTSEGPTAAHIKENENWMEFQ